MKVKIDKTFELEHHIDTVWTYLSNPSKIVSCVPGAQITEQIDEHNYKGEVSLKFGPVAAKYNGQVKIDNLDKDNYEMNLSGKGRDSKGKGSAAMNMKAKLDEVDDGTTSVKYSMELSVSGVLAQFGSRLIEDVSNQLSNEFIENFKSKLDSETGQMADSAASKTSPRSDTAASASSSVNVFALMFKVIKNAIARMFGRSE